MSAGMNGRLLVFAPQCSGSFAPPLYPDRESPLTTRVTGYWRFFFSKDQTGRQHFTHEAVIAE